MRSCTGDCPDCPFQGWVDYVLKDHQLRIDVGSEKQYKLGIEIIENSERAQESAPEIGRILTGSFDKPLLLNTAYSLVNEERALGMDLEESFELHDVIEGHERLLQQFRNGEDELKIWEEMIKHFKSLSAQAAETCQGLKQNNWLFRKLGWGALECSSPTSRPFRKKYRKFIKK